MNFSPHFQHVDQCMCYSPYGIVRQSRQDVNCRFALAMYCRFQNIGRPRSMRHPPPSYTYAVSNPYRYAFAFAPLHESRTPCKERKKQINRQCRQLYRERYASNTEMRKYKNIRPLRINNVGSFKLWMRRYQNSPNPCWMLL